MKSCCIGFFLLPSLVDCVQERHIIHRSALRHLMLFLYTRVHSGIVSLLMISMFEQVTFGQSKIRVDKRVSDRMGIDF